MAEPSSSTAITTTSPSSLQGPSPAPLGVRRDSHNIRKARQPVIIYTASPKVVHAEPSEFMSVVQRLTGAPSSSLPEPPAGGHQHSLQPFPLLPSSSSLPHFPFQLHHHQQQAAARLDAVPSSGGGVFDVVGGHSLPPLPSILPPVPGSLPAVPPPGASGGDEVNLQFGGELISPAFLAATTTTTTGGATEITHPTSSPPAYWDLFNNYHHHSM
jgi:MAP kinase substrate 1